MRKRISLKTRRPDLSRKAFREHYEEVHVPLGLGFIDRFHWRRYRRNHVLESHGAPIGFDCYAEFWVDEDDDDSALSEFVQSTEFQVLNEDDERFLDTRQRASFDVKETTLVANTRANTRADARVEARAATGLEDGSVTLAVALRDGEQAGQSAEAVAAGLLDLLGSLVVEATLDVRLGSDPTGPPPAAPFDRLIRLSLEGEPPATLDPSRFGGDRCSLLRLDPVETPAELLYAEPEV